MHDILRDHAFEILLLGGQIAKSAEFIAPPMREALADLPALRLVDRAADIDTAALRGVARACWQA